ncbi:MAG: hypothetical protein COT55_03005 [Candidatus Diapherotrites archaeon CG09_land_8_20_14_0_10_32_12]|nr:MAG: hypothetical protein COT55_03005 [Candidatus Diapherotrites archaeon CG09_land_8_20_14_0_10_32_12]
MSRGYGFLFHRQNYCSISTSVTSRHSDGSSFEYVYCINPHVWVRPKYVVEVLYDEITKSPTHLCAKDEMGGLALRFPRLIKIRSDKNKVQTSTTKEVLELFKSQ